MISINYNFIFMKRNLFIVVSLFLTTILYGQRPVVTVFSENGEKFWLIMDGVKKNAEPQYRVENIVMENDWAKVKIIFEDPGMPDIEKTIQGLDYDGKPNAVTHIIKKTKKGSYEMKVLSWKPITELPTQQVVQSEKPAGQTHIVNEAPVQTNTQTTDVQNTGTETTTNRGVTPNSGQESAGINVNLGTQGQDGANINLKVDITVPGQATESNTTSVVTSTTSNTSGESQMETPEPTQVVNNENTKQDFNCNGPVNEGDFNTMKNSISSKSFEDSKLTTAKQVVKANCLSSAQVKDILELFSFEQTKLDFAKLAYLNTWDKRNYYIVNDAFTFESTIEELSEYINSIH